MAKRRPGIPDPVWQFVSRYLLENTGTTILGRVVDSKVDTYVLCGWDDFLPIRIGADDQIRNLELAPNFHLEVLSDLDHSSWFMAHRQRLVASIASHLEKTYAEPALELDPSPPGDLTSGAWGVPAVGSRRGGSGPSTVDGGRRTRLTRPGRIHHREERLRLHRPCGRLPGELAGTGWERRPVEDRLHRARRRHRVRRPPTGGPRSRNPATGVATTGRPTAWNSRALIGIQALGERDDLVGHHQYVGMLQVGRHRRVGAAAQDDRAGLEHLGFGRLREAVGAEEYQRRPSGQVARQRDAEADVESAVAERPLVQHDATGREVDGTFGRTPEMVDVDSVGDDVHRSIPATAVGQRR